MASSAAVPGLSDALLDSDIELGSDATLIACLTRQIDGELVREIVDAVVGFVGGDNDTAFKLRLCLVELHGNAVRHAGGVTRVRVWWLRIVDQLFVAVGDKCSAPPLRCADPSLDAEGGRGLLLVEAHSSTNGFALHATGKDVWFALTIARRYEGDCALHPSDTGRP
ncbi:ATP-binding protein [Embleya sp. NPDC020630]|uniref:ATP-binding protein n=1 Tax=Embleya sp. NPDC020630 TaxID=3363979 RepID=UPI00378809C9